MVDPHDMTSAGKCATEVKTSGFMTRVVNPIVGRKEKKIKKNTSILLSVTG